MTEVRGKQLVEVPLEHYRSLYAQCDAAEIAARTALVYDAAKQRFELRLMGSEYYVNHPFFCVTAAGSLPAAAEAGRGLHSPYEEILLLRYLTGGKFAPTTGAMLAYEEMPWGSVYISQFKGRVLGRAAREFGRDPDALGIALKRLSGLSQTQLDTADAAYRFEFLNGFYVSLLVWSGDDEFPASAQLLFSDNFKYAFTAEDMAACGDIVLSRIKQALKGS